MLRPANVQKFRLEAGVFLLVLFILLPACATAPYTGRSQLMLVPEEQAAAMGEQAAEQILQQERKSTNQDYVAMVERVGQRIVSVTEQTPYTWQFHTIAGDQANAFALPGGYVFIYEGIFKYADSEAKLATVIAHEIAHVLVDHGSERMSMQLLSQLGETAAKTALSIQSPTATQAFDVAYGLASNVGVILPYSRQQELEADKVGLVLMAKAGYDPRAAIDFWQAMSSEKGAEPPVFLSTHPTGAQRIEQIRQFMPEALQHYRR
ncbi:MAG: M48 family metallopeptidase [Desulfovibrionales bacterium]